MHLLKNLVHKFRTMHPVAKLAVKLGVGLMGCYYVVGLASYISAPYVAGYFRAMAVCRGCLEAAPASLAAGVCAGLLGDMLLSRYTEHGDHGKNNDDD